MTNVRNFGLLSAFAAAVAFLAHLLVAPALLAVVELSRSLPERGTLPVEIEPTP